VGEQVPLRQAVARGAHDVSSAQAQVSMTPNGQQMV
jgi:hypothetical protein